MPEKVGEWAQLELSEGFKTEVGKEGDSGFMRASVFDRAEMSLVYSEYAV